MKKLEICDKINYFKQLLRDSDYLAIKLMEGELTAEEYAPVKEQRKQWRAEINQLEKQIEELNQNL